MLSQQDGETHNGKTRFSVIKIMGKPHLKYTIDHNKLPILGNQLGQAVLTASIGPKSILVVNPVTPNTTESASTHPVIPQSSHKCFKDDDGPYTKKQ
jgi:hypothetical protein